jgi:hypothetical protein
MRSTDRIRAPRASSSRMRSTNSRTLAGSLSLFLSLIVGVTPVAFGDDPFARAGAALSGPVAITMAAPHARGATGDNVDVPITIKGASGLGCLQMVLVYDEKLLEVTGVDKGSLLGELAIFDHDTTAPGRLGLGFLSGPKANRAELAQIDGDGTVFIVHFKVLGRAGQRSLLTPQRTQAWQVSDEKLGVQTDAGEFVITGGFPWLYLLLGIFASLLLLTVLSRRRTASKR